MLADWDSVTRIQCHRPIWRSPGNAPDLCPYVVERNHPLPPLNWLIPQKRLQGIPLRHSAKRGDDPQDNHATTHHHVATIGAVLYQHVRQSTRLPTAAEAWRYTAGRPDQLDAMTSWYERHVLPYLIDCACGMPAVERQRAQVVPLAEGRVLEIGIGTGRNLRHYDPQRVEQLEALDPALQWHPLAHKRTQAVAFPVKPLALSAEQIPEDDHSFDCVVCTYTLCTIPHPVQALQEFRRVLKPGGKLLLSEHGLAPDDSVQRWQRRLEPVWKHFSGGCHLTRDVPALLEEAGFAWDSLDRRYLKGPKPVTYNYRGVAHAR